MKTMGLIGAASVVLGACASSPVPADRLAQSQAAVRSAQEVGADKIPPAALHLRIANEELELARRLMRDGDNQRAEYILLRAQADAEAALALAREDQARADAQKALAQVQQLRNSRPEGT
jgi:hypothetical protein